MPCSSPIQGFRRSDGGFTSSVRDAPGRVRMSVPCGQCLMCRVAKRDDWVCRALHERSFHDGSCFVTLTYEDRHLPPFGSLRMDDVSSWLKRLRERVRPRVLRFYASSEYGPRTFRPHYHVLLFGLDFLSEPHEQVRTTDAGAASFRCDLLSDTWGLGVAEFSALNRQSCAYVAKHNVDKLTDAVADDFYRRVDPETGEIVEVERPCTRMSRRPGIGMRWAEAFDGDCFPSGFLVVGGRKRPVPRAYRKVLKDRFTLPGSKPSSFVPVDDAEIMARQSRVRSRTPQARANSTPDRLAVREEVLRLKLSRFKRDGL